MALALIMLLGAYGASATPYGFSMGYAVREVNNVCGIVVAPGEDLIQTPLFKRYNRDDIQWWYNLAEEAAFANASYLALNFRGDSPCGIFPPNGNEPTVYASSLVQAINQRGYTNILKVALFDDTAAYPGHLHQCDTSRPTFDMGDQALWQTYFWDMKWKPFFTRVPDANRMKINGKPLVFMWSVVSAFGFVNQPGNLAPLLQWLRNKCLTEFGFDPFIVVDQGFPIADPAFGSAADGVENWFGDQNRAWSVRTYFGRSGWFTTGVAVPGFYKPGEGSFIDRASGATLADALFNVSVANLVLLEGLTDAEENAGFYRGGSVCDPDCKPSVPPSGQCYSHANQYLNIVREHISPDQDYFVLEAEASDDFYTLNTVGSGLYRRDDPLDIVYTDATQSQWAVRLRPTEWLQYRALNIGPAAAYQLGFRYASTAGASGRLVRDGSTAVDFCLPPTGSDTVYASYFISRAFGISPTFHDVRLEVTVGVVLVDQWVLAGLAASPGGTTLFNVQPCRVVDTRNAQGPFGGPAIAAGSRRRFLVGGQCGVPATARAVALNLTVVGPTHVGNVAVVQGDACFGEASTVHYSAGQTRANNAIIGLDLTGQLTVEGRQPAGTTHVIIDVNGYFQ